MEFLRQNWEEFPRKIGFFKNHGELAQRSEVPVSRDECNHTAPTEQSELKGLTGEVNINSLLFVLTISGLGMCSDSRIQHGFFLPLFLENFAPVLVGLIQTYPP